MLKQMPTRNQRSKGFKVKHTLQKCLVVVICTWLLYQLKQSHDKKACEKTFAKISGKVDGEHEIKLGRRVLHPPVPKTGFGIERHGEEEKALEKREGGGDDELNSHDRDRYEEEEEFEVEDLIDEEEEDNEEFEKEIEDEAQYEGGKSNNDATMKHYKKNDASSFWMQGTKSISTKFDVGSLRKLKEEKLVDTKKIVGYN
ncbi:dentin sialophosphoprotein-like [Quillaja saponaria]|uniref:Dentin sialophosphoprotein-like n=1 Tax=Quillaja saponaria TaxID=32244 RepID=A0AAD7LIM7_QUISA|nr:dentin sialophosphoprotein-like [Quillaja saponaria]